MPRLRAFGAFWYDFVVGDDWRLAVAVVVGLALTALLSAVSGIGWLALPVVVVGVLALSLVAVARAGRDARVR